MLKTTKVNDNVKTVPYCHLSEAIKLVWLHAFVRAFILLKGKLKMTKHFSFCNEITKEGRALRKHKFCWKINMQLQLDFSYERLVE